MSGRRGGQYGVFRRALGWRVQTLPPFPPGEGTPVSCCASSEGRCGESVEVRYLGGAQGHEGVAQGLRLAGHGLDLAFAVRVLVGVEALRHRRAAMFSQAVDETGERVGRRRDGVGGSQAATHPPIEGPQCRARVLDRARGETQSDGDAMRAGAHPP